MGTNHSAVQHMLPVIGQPQIYQGLQQGIPHTLFSPTPKPDINRVPFAVALMHVAPGTACAQNIQHAIEKQALVSSWTGPTSALRWQKQTNQQPFMIRQIASCPSLFLLPVTYRQELKQVSPKADRPFVKVI
ncbi:hypothetical protein AA0535_2133 [Asaia krungthepensis NRIC 0535]|uniref:Uncharacterized protein n=1 Tax=Asaia krungthepensis NRIC 0535 TaxID=1307925 RepID=A0ABQ0Q4D1_9PROT|nr:hypothetical protein AA0535_2133 [Asaia krungthepensis NRIC 0535]